MIVTDQFVFIHLPKTGGTFITDMLQRLDQQTGRLNLRHVPEQKHAGVARIPRQYQDRPVLMAVRNVFEHYVSRYHFAWWADPQHARQLFILERVYQSYPHFPDLSLPEFVEFFCDWQYKRQPTRTDRANRLNSYRIGYNTWTLCRLALRKPMEFIQEFDAMSDNEILEHFQHIRFLHTESLNSDLCSLLAEFEFTSEQLGFIRDAGPTLPKWGGRGTNLSWHNRFDQDLTRFVMERDRLYFRLFPHMIPGVHTPVDTAT